MIIMQYQFALPAQFDMNIIRQRIEQNGHKLNGFPDLGFKAFMFQEQDSPDIYQLENNYAPFYFWNSSDGMKEFLASDGYHNLEQAFGRPEVCSYLPFIHKQYTNVSDSRYVLASKENVSRDTNIRTLLTQQQALADNFNHSEVTAYIVALDTKMWNLHTWLFFRSTIDRQELTRLDANRGAELNTFQVGYVAK
ncbi:DUF4865 family protein [Marinomonas sp. TW1]|uniref:DUF4865 family protein n=1 Tax=Marinomonas sp. TW1 TaxID=1561203 RepID=UPI0007AF5860|nr:DUF4865 family protein [Marinomonas sp. TW1]